MDDDVDAGSRDDGRAGCSCLPPFCFWRGSRGPAAPERRLRRRRRRRLRLRLSWLSWVWLRKSGGGKEEEANGKKGKRRRRRMLLLLLTSLHAKKALASVSSSGSSLLPKVSSLGDAKKQSRSQPRQTTADGAAPTTSGARGTAPSAGPETIGQPCPRPAGDGVRRAPSRLHALRHGRGADGGMWTMATTLGVIVFFGRVTAVIFLCSCLYGVRFGARAGGEKITGNGVASGGSSRRFGDRVAMDLCTEEHKKKVVME